MISRKIFLFILVLSYCVFSKSAESENRKGNRLYRKALEIKKEEKEKDSKEAAGLFKEALSHYEKGKIIEPDESRLSYNTGNARFQLGEYDKAAEEYTKALDGASAKLRKDAHFNRGNSRVFSVLKDPSKKEAEKLLKGALDDYKKVLLEDPDDYDAKANFEITGKILEKLEEMRQEQKQNQEQQEQKDRNENQNQDQNKQDEQNNNENKKDEQNEQNEQDEQDGQDGNNGEDDSQDDKKQEDDNESSKENKKPGEDGKKPDGNKDRKKQAGEDRKSSSGLTPEEAEAL
ncbi:MAG: tetratricopeptide repeat protein, partial [Fibrobacterota bacterium]